MKTVVVNKKWNQESAEQSFSYALNAPLGHIKRHLASEVTYARKGIASVMNPGPGKIDLKVSLASSTGLSTEESNDLKKFLEQL